MFPITQKPRKQLGKSAGSKKDRPPPGKLFSGGKKREGPSSEATRKRGRPRKVVKLESDSVDKSKETGKTAAKRAQVSEEDGKIVNTDSGEEDGEAEEEVPGEDNTESMVQMAPSSRKRKAEAEEKKNDEGNRGRGGGKRGRKTTGVRGISLQQVSDVEDFISAIIM